MKVVCEELAYFNVLDALIGAKTTVHHPSRTNNSVKIMFAECRVIIIYAL